ncbi:Fc.00g033780.m01.CDS01 [Cosmosporella sp. VM-42]
MAKEHSSLPTEQSFKLNGRYIYSATTTTQSIATYHISTRNTRSGNPWQLQISRLLPSESRRLSMSTYDGNEPLIKYDEDLTLYAAEKLTVPLSIGQKPLLCIRGRRRGTLQGTIILEKTLGRSRSYKFWHMTPIRRALTKAEEERLQALMHKRGYRTSDDWKKELLLSVRGNGPEELQWTDEDDVPVAIERDGQLITKGDVNPDRRDQLIVCWASKNFVQEKKEDEVTATPNDAIIVDESYLS